MATLDQVLAILTGAKVFTGRQWRVYDANGAELADPGGVLWRGVHGALLWNANWRAAIAQPLGDQFNYKGHVLLGRYVGDPAIGRVAQRMRLTSRRRH